MRDTPERRARWSCSIEPDSVLGSQSVSRTSKRWWRSDEPDVPETPETGDATGFTTSRTFWRPPPPSCTPLSGDFYGVWTTSAWSSASGACAGGSQAAAWRSGCAPRENISQLQEILEQNVGALPSQSGPKKAHVSWMQQSQAVVTDPSLDSRGSKGIKNIVY